MESKIRNSGIDVIGNTPWGTHFCLFYQTKEDLIDILVPYFKAGLENNEYCMWVTSEPLNKKEAEKAIRRAIPNFDEYLENNQIEIIPYTEWYIEDNKFESDRVLNGWVEKCNSSLDNGFSGLRLTGNTFWLEKKDWNNFRDYEHEVNDVIGNSQMMGICTYSLDKCGSFELLDIIQNHQFALIRREGSWEMFKSSEQTKFEQQLKESEILYRTTVNGLKEPLHVINKNLEIILINDALKRIVEDFNLNTDIIGKPINEAFSFLSNKVLDEYRSVFKNKSPLITQEETLFDGKEIITETRKIPIFDNEKNVIQIITIIRDITESKRSKEKLKESEEKFRGFLDFGNIGMAITSIDKKWVYYNDQICEIFGFTREELLEKTWADLSYPEDLQSEVEQFNKILKGEIDSYQIDKRYIKRNGEIIYAHLTISCIRNSDGSVKYFLATLQDITKRKNAEQKLKELTERYERLTDNADVAIFWVKIKGREIVHSIPGNPAAERLFGYSKAEWLSDSTLGFKIIHPDFVEKQIQIMDEININKKPIKNAVLGWIAKDGHEVIMEYTIIPILDDNGEIVFFESIGVDITKRKKTEQKLKESEEKYSTLAKLSPVGIFNTDQKGDCLYVNERWSQIAGLTPDQALGTGWVDGIHPNDRKRVSAEWYNAAVNNVPFESEYRFKRLDSKITWVYGQAIAIKDNLGKITGYVGTITDITELKKTEKKLKDLNKLKSEFLRRASHELKTPLISIKGFSDLILSIYADQLDTSIVSKLKEINDGCRRLMNIINNLLKTSRLESTELKPKLQKEDLSFLIKFCVHELESLAEMRNQSIKLDILNDLYANIEKEEIHDVLSNLLTNAIKYTPPNGKITINTDLKEDYVVISLKDNGIGFTNEEKKKIFQQFGKIERYGQGLDLGIDGTGLGLYISKKIVESHGGKIWMESEGKSRGSTFYFTIPII